MDEVTIDHFPFEIYLPIADQKNFLGRIVINQLQREYSAEIDVVYSETKKIFKHITILYLESDSPHELLGQAIWKLSSELQNI